MDKEWKKCDGLIDKLRDIMEDRKMNAIDLFAGCGGLSKGFMDAGFDILIGVDNDQAALDTFEMNHNGAVAMNADLSKQETFDEIRKIVGKRNIDVIIAGPPCQGFSLTGPRNFDDERNKLYLAVIEMVKQCKPKGFVIENVTGMATLYKGQIKDEILRRFRALGYNIECKILCAADYGVPQMRKRLIFMGVRKDIGMPKFPEPVFLPETYRTCRDAISDLPPRITELGKEVDTYISEPKTEYQKLCVATVMYYIIMWLQIIRRWLKIHCSRSRRRNYKDLPPMGREKKFNEAWTRYDGNKPSKMIDTDIEIIFIMSITVYQQSEKMHDYNLSLMILYLQEPELSNIDR